MTGHNSTCFGCKIQEAVPARSFSFRTAIHSLSADTFYSSYLSSSPSCLYFSVFEYGVVIPPAYPFSQNQCCQAKS
jgi:hypothetical protein